MPPQRTALARRTALLTGSFYDKSGAIGDGFPSPTTAFPSLNTPGRNLEIDFDMSDASENGWDDEYTLTGYGELSPNEPFMLPPSPTQTIKYRYRAYRPKLARIGKKYRAFGKTKSSAYHASDYSLNLGVYIPGLSGRSTKREFQALMHKYRDSAEGWRDSDTSIAPRKMYSDKTWSARSGPVAPVSTSGRHSVPGTTRTFL